MLSKPNPITIQLDQPLAGLIGSCERECVSECCGIDAFDFSPLFIATYLSAYGGSINPDNIDSLLDQIAKIRVEHCGEPLQDIELTHQIEIVNQNFTSTKLSAMLDEIEYNLKKASEVFELSELIRLNT